MIATAALAAVSVGVSIYGGAQKNKEGRKMQQEAQKKLDQFKWEDLKNAYENVQLSTVGTDLRREEAARSSAGIVDALRSGGNRAVLGGLGSVQFNDNLVNQQIAADLDQQDKNRQYAIAQDNTRLRDARLQQQGAELAGLGQLYNVGMQTKYSGLGDIASGIGAASQLAGSFGSQSKGTMTQADNGAGNVNWGQYDFGTSNLQSGGTINSVPVVVNSSSLSPDYTKIYGGNVSGGMNYGMGGSYNLNLG